VTVKKASIHLNTEKPHIGQGHMCIKVRNVDEGKLSLFLAEGKKLHVAEK
jgi:hypothetical protein